MLVLDAGDSLIGDQDPALKTRGQTSVELMNMMAYDAMVLGPQDLALGPAVLARRIAEAEFAILSANAVIEATGELVATPYVMRELEGHKVAIVGLSARQDTGEIVVRDPLETINSILPEVNKQADIIILLSHAGADVDQQIADAVSGIDVIVSGGVPALRAAWRSEKTGTLIVRADAASPGHAGRRVGAGRLVFDPGGQLVEQNWQGVDLLTQFADDPAMAAWVQKQLSQ